MLNLKEMIFGRAERMPLDGRLQAALDAWRDASAPDLDQPHYLTRYVVVDVATSGLDASRDRVIGLAALGISQPAGGRGQGGVILPEDAFAVDFTGTPDAEAMTDQQLLAFLRFVGRGPLVTYQAPFVGEFLGRLLVERLGVEWQPDWLDLAWLLPDLFKEKIDAMVSLDDWADAFGIEIPGRHDALADCVAIAKLWQLALPRALERGADTAAKMIGIGKARRWLRPGG